MRHVVVYRHMYYNVVIVELMFVHYERVLFYDDTQLDVITASLASIHECMTQGLYDR